MAETSGRLALAGALVAIAMTPLPAIAQVSVDEITKYLNEDQAAFFAAVARGQDARVTDLLARGADVNATASRGWTPLMIAARRSHVGVAEILLTQPSVDINKTDSIWMTALKYASAFEHLSMISLLLSDPRTDVNVHDSVFGDTALIVAAKEGKSEAVKLLLSHPKIDTTLMDRFGKTALDNARDARVADPRATNRAEIVRRLRADSRKGDDLRTESVSRSASFNERGKAQIERGGYMKAIALLSTSIELNPRNASAFYNRGTVRALVVGVLEDDLEGALSDFDRAIEIDASAGEFFAARGMVRLRRGDRVGGCRDLNKATQLGLSVDNRVLERCS